jgi:hypothetical protein
MATDATPGRYARLRGSTAAWGRTLAAMTVPERRRKAYVRHRKPPTGEFHLWVAPDLAAKALGCSERTIRRKCLQGDLECVDMGGGWMVAKSELPVVEVVQVASEPASERLVSHEALVSAPDRVKKLAPAAAGLELHAPLRRLPAVGPAAPVVQVELEEPAIY